MKKLFVSVGLAAMGASSLHAQYAPGLTPQEMSKPWSVSASLRGFYDDNYLTLPKATARSTYGVEASPSAAMNYSPDNQTSLSVSYIFDLRWYTDKSTTDTSHQFNAKLSHEFSERYSMAASESFILAQEPTVVQQAGAVSTPLRVNGNNIHNTAMVSGTAQLTSLLSLEASYQNDIYSYQQTFGDVYNPNPAAYNPSYAALLNRMEQLAGLTLDWKAMDDLTALLGYQYGHTEYTSKEGIIFDTLGNASHHSNERNSDSHFLFVGVNKDFTAQLHGAIRVGGEYIDYYNAAGKPTSTSPYVDASLTWQYMQDSSLQVGVKHQHNATDVIGSVNSTGQPVLDAESTAAYASINHTIAGNLTGSVLGQFQHSEFNGGSVNGKSEDFAIVNLNLAYSFSPYLSAETGYGWSKLTSDIGTRDYTRNEVYIGVRASY